MSSCSPPVTRIPRLSQVQQAGISNYRLTYWRMLASDHKRSTTDVVGYWIGSCISVFPLKLHVLGCSQEILHWVPCFRSDLAPLSTTLRGPNASRTLFWAWSSMSVSEHGSNCDRLSVSCVPGRAWHDLCLIRPACVIACVPDIGWWHLVTSLADTYWWHVSQQNMRLHVTAG